ncbi:DNA cytosine methyltransferase [Pseudomonas fulva]|uniref:DNA cytosine methyltransferase n=1 Tax=Pseudomonas fulva TaxID=47880 RepID=UPI0018AC4BFE|nr:DNA cytosine methyltransferase [Pseudomonas fulva]MBF8674847.1 DNA cytosine methyltransferase [Pseudomonas fulva]MBF8696594.1 DNA cytosine methyltransferase [Pseudomonas fulva]
MKTREFTAIDLFSGCGGLSLGLEQAGFRVAAAVEIASKAIETYKANHPKVALYDGDIRDIEPLSILRDIGIKPGELDLLAGCPPCQGFSRLRTKNKTNSVIDERNDLISDFIRFAKNMMPKCIMLENVPSLTKDERFELAVHELRTLGYHCTVQVLDAANYGVPQRRKRLIMLASRVHEPVLAKQSEARVTVRQAFSSIPTSAYTNDLVHLIPERRSQAVQHVISLIPKNGGSRRDLPDEYQLDCHKKSDGFRDVYGRMYWDAVSPTITSGCHNPSKGRFLHPEFDRTITLREAAILQGFPANYYFNPAHGKEAIALMIGNALPPPFIAAHAKSLKSGILLD